MSPILVGILLVLAGVAGVLWGYRIFRILLPIYGGVAGYVIAWNWLGADAWLLALIVGVVLAIILAVIAYFLWSVLFAISGAVLGVALAGVIVSTLNFPQWLAVLLAIVLAVLLGWLFWKFRNEMIIIATVLVGAGLAAEGVGMIFGLKTGIGARLNPQPILWLLVAVVWVVLVIVGLGYQWRRYRHSNLWGFGLEPSPAPAAEPAPVVATRAVEVPLTEAAAPAAAVGAAAVAAGVIAAEKEEPVVEAEAAAPDVEAVGAGAAAVAVGAIAAEEEPPVVEAEAVAPGVEAVGTGAAAAVAAAGEAAEAEPEPVAEAARAADLKALEATLSPGDLANLRQKVEFIEGVGANYAAKLAQAGVVTVMDLLQRGATRKGRAELVDATGIAAGLLLKWINHADLFRVKGVGKQFGELLEAAGVDTVVELAQRNPVNLFNRMAQVNTEKKLSGRAPRQDEVSNWVEQAKGLPRIIQY
jgi:predicted flap endonuclease-1-like 5' DNA nuclease